MSRSKAAVLGAVLFLGATAALGFTVLQWTDRADALDRGAILQLLADGQFDELDQRLNEIDDEVNAQKRPEAKLQQAFNAFATSDPAVVAQLDRWVTERPNSGMALVARGVNRFHLIKITRYAEAFRTANASFARDLKIKERDAFIDAQKGLGIKEKNPVGFVWSIELFIDWGQPQEVEKWYRIAINDLPASPGIHRAYLSAYTPWRQAGPSWQDSLVRLKEITESLQKGFGKDPDFAWLAGYLDYVKGETYRLDGQPAEPSRTSMRRWRRATTPSTAWGGLAPIWRWVTGRWLRATSRRYCRPTLISHPRSTGGRLPRKTSIRWPRLWPTSTGPLPSIR